MWHANGEQRYGHIVARYLFLLGHQIFASCKNGKLARRRSEFIRSLSLPFTPLLKFDIIYKTWFLFLIHGVPVWIIAQCQGGHFNKQIRPFLRRRISTRDYSSDQSYLDLPFSPELFEISSTRKALRGIGPISHQWKIFLNVIWLKSNRCIGQITLRVNFRATLRKPLLDFSW